jgi:hypothetical protein
MNGLMQVKKKRLPLGAAFVFESTTLNDGDVDVHPCRA